MYALSICKYILMDVFFIIMYVCIYLSLSMYVCIFMYVCVYKSFYIFMYILFIGESTIRCHCIFLTMMFMFMISISIGPDAGVNFLNPRVSSSNRRSQLLYKSKLVIKLCTDKLIRDKLCTDMYVPIHTSIYYCCVF